MKHFTEAFIKDCKKGDRKAQQALFEQLYVPMFRICQRYVGIDADAEDCIMKGFMKAFNKINTFNYEGDHSLFHWIRRIMVNEALMFIRQKHNFNLSLDEEVNDIGIPAEAWKLMDAEEINHLILSLPTGYRTVFNLYAVEGYDHKTISKMLGINESTSRTQLAKARSRLKILLEQKSESYERRG